MPKNPWWAKVLRFVAILLLGATALFTLAGGLGGICVALNPTGFGENMAKLAPMQWLYGLFVVFGIALGVMGIRSTIMLIKGADKAYSDAVYVLLAGAVIGFVHMDISRSLRGSSMPVDAVVYTTALTLIVFLLLRIPPIWDAVHFDRISGGGDLGRIAGASTLVVCGLLTLTMQYWAGPSHTWNGTNWADAWHISMWIFGSGLMIGGLLAAFWKRLTMRKPSLARSGD